MEDRALERQRRADERRSRIRFRKTRLGEAEHDFSPVRGAEAISLLTRLSEESWALTGRPVERYSRSAIPVRFVPNSPPR